ncbi:hypothetical protein [Piscirickettsia salmonis]|uniref:hypothetical protein n=1 Tax=Piscirickettsia salmonis TaxID=1238 RepID=UPI0012BA6DD8|nr:hypothetical protein [Piscirickettsia salmonis]
MLSTPWLAADEVVIIITPEVRRHLAPCSYIKLFSLNSHNLAQFHLPGLKYVLLNHSFLIKKGADILTNQMLGVSPYFNIKINFKQQLILIIPKQVKPLYFIKL